MWNMWLWYVIFLSFSEMYDILQAVHTHGECCRNNQVCIVSMHHFSKSNSSDFTGHFIYSHFPSFRFEKMAEQCKKSLEILKLAQNRGLQPPKHHFEERTYRTVRCDTLSANLTSIKKAQYSFRIWGFSTGSTFLTTVQHRAVRGNVWSFIKWHLFSYFFFLTSVLLGSFQSSVAQTWLLSLLEGWTFLLPLVSFKHLFLKQTFNFKLNKSIFIHFAVTFIQSTFKAYIFFSTSAVWELK